MLVSKCWRVAFRRDQETTDRYSDVVTKRAARRPDRKKIAFLRNRRGKGLKYDQISVIYLYRTVSVRYRYQERTHRRRVFDRFWLCCFRDGHFRGKGFEQPTRNTSTLKKKVHGKNVLADPHDGLRPGRYGGIGETRAREH